MSNATEIFEYQGQQFEVPVLGLGRTPGATRVRGADLRSAFGLKDGQTLIRPTADAHQVVRPSDELELNQGERFGSVSQFVAAGRHTARLNVELPALAKIYGSDNVVWPPNQDWVMVYDFTLPKGWQPRTTNIVVLIPDNYGHGVPLKHCFVEPNLRYQHNGDWVTIDHYFDQPNGFTPTGGEQFRQKEWRYLCLHMEEWKPESWLASYLDVVTTYLSNPYYPWPGNKRHQ